MSKSKKIIAVVTVNLLLATYILNIIDYVQTMYAVQIFGVGVELNPIGRFCLEYNYAPFLKFIVMFLILSFIGFIVIKIESKFVYVPCVLAVWYVVVVWHNFNQLKLAGILDYQLEEQIVTIVSIICAVVTVISAIVTGVLCAYYKRLKKH